MATPRPRVTRIDLAACGSETSTIGAVIFAMLITLVSGMISIQGNIDVTASGKIELGVFFFITATIPRQ
jgi:hypothetical protein